MIRVARVDTLENKHSDNREEPSCGDCVARCQQSYLNQNPARYGLPDCVQVLKMFR
jgi:hypothetical protein